jgi:hypothetical protein
MSELKTALSEFDENIERIMSGEKALSYSALSAFLKSPKHYYEYCTDKETTPAMKEGQIFHMACLEPEKFAEKYWVLDDSEKCKEIGGSKPRNTNKYKDWVVSQELLHKGKERISQEDYNTFMRMSEALKKNKSSKILMNNLTDKEKAFDFEHDGFKFKGKIDGCGELKENNFYNYPLGKFQIDLKKVADASYKKIRWNIQDMNYDLQGGLYSASQRVRNYFLIFIDKSCNITVVRILPENLDKGFIKLENALAEFTRCAEENQWHGSYDFFNGGFINY